MWTANETGVLTAGTLRELLWLRHGFGTKKSVQWPEVSSRVVTLRQTHSSTVWTVRSGEGCLGEGDALVTAEPGILLTIRTADCVPVLLADPVKRVVAAVHAGWRGTAAGIVPATVSRMVEEYGVVPANLIAAVGPSIGPCCFEVGNEVAVQFPRTRREKNIDLWYENRLQLQDAGLGQITLAERCTVCEPEWFYSFRKDKATGRMVTGIGISSRNEKGGATE